MTLDGEELELIDRLVRHDRTAVSTALLVIAGIGAGEASRRAVLAAVDEAARSAQAEGCDRFEQSRPNRPARRRSSAGATSLLPREPTGAQARQPVDPAKGGEEVRVERLLSDVSPALA